MHLKKIFTRVHLVTLIILLTNFIFNLIFDVTLISDLRFVLKTLFYTSACILFFYYIKPFKKKALYFGFYIFSPVFIFFSWLADGILGALLSSIFFFFFQPPNDVRFENDQIQIQTNFTGFLGNCCSYKVTEKKYFLFEKKLSEFQFERNLYFEKDDIKIQKDTLKMHLILKYYNEKDHYYFAKDTTIYTLLK